MNVYKVTLSFCFAIVFATEALINPAPANAQSLPVADKGFAVVELFTSEGCSSCPPADDLITKIQHEIAGKPVYILAYHVDYWNRLGWKDPYSSATFSKRQNDYANWLKSSSVYTPQIVVNGRTEFVGSQESTLRNAIKNGLKKFSPTHLILSGLQLNGGTVDFNYQLTNAAKLSTLVIALVQKEAQTRVLKGENGGRTLFHVQLVRVLKTNTLTDVTKGNTSINLPVGIDPKSLKLIAFLQNAATGEVTAATQSEI